VTDPALEVRTLTDGGQTTEQVAGWVADFLDGADRSLDIALYDLAVGARAEDLVVGSIRMAVERGVAVRLAHNVDHANPIPVPPPPETDPQLIAACGVPVKAIPGVPDLMHHKYVVRDGNAVWTGSTNWTDDSWTREENVVAVVRSPGIASWFSRNFEELWTTARVAGTGEYVPEPAVLGNTSVRAWFCPGRSRRLVQRIASAIGRADRRVRVCSPVLTSASVVATLAERAADGRLDVAGVIDATQMDQVFTQWRRDGHSAWKIPIARALFASALFGGKRSTPYGPGTVHDYMHAKFVVADEVVFMGSYNLSHAGEENAENVLEIVDADLAERMASFADEIRARYRPYGRGRVP